MALINLENCSWITPGIWYVFMNRHKKPDGTLAVNEDDIDQTIDELIQWISWKTSSPYNELKKLFFEKNTILISEKQKMFRKKYETDQIEKVYSILGKYLVIPAANYFYCANLCAKLN